MKFILNLLYKKFAKLTYGGVKNILKRFLFQKILSYSNEIMITENFVGDRTFEIQMSYQNDKN